MEHFVVIEGQGQAKQCTGGIAGQARAGRPKKMVYGTRLNSLVPYAHGATPKAYGTRQFKSI